MLSEIGIFPCPNCTQMINAGSDMCRFCETPINRELALAAAKLQGRVNRACSDASYLKTAGILLYVFLGLSLVPLMPLVSWGFLALFVVLLALLARWQMLFGSLATKDPDYELAKKQRNLAFVLWLCALPAFFVTDAIVNFILGTIMGR